MAEFIRLRRIIAIYENAYFVFATVLVMAFLPHKPNSFSFLCTIALLSMWIRCSKDKTGCDAVG